MSAANTTALDDLRGVVRIAKAASVGVTGNGPRIQRAEAAIAAVADLVEAVRTHQSGKFQCACDRCKRVRAALAAFEVNA